MDGAPKKGYPSLMTNYRGISLLLITAGVYNKIQLNRIQEHVDPILRSTRLVFCSWRSCAKQIHILRRIMEGFQDYQLSLTFTFIDFKKAFDSINRNIMFAVFVALWDTWSSVWCHRDTTQQLEKCSDGRWKHIWSFWCLYWCPAGWRSSDFPFHHISRLFTEEGHIRQWFGSSNASSPRKALSSESVKHVKWSWLRWW